MSGVIIRIIGCYSIGQRLALHPADRIQLVTSQRQLVIKCIVKPVSRIILITDNFPGRQAARGWVCNGHPVAQGVIAVGHRFVERIGD